MICFAQKLVSAFEIRITLGQKCSTAWLYATTGVWNVCSYTNMYDSHFIISVHRTYLLEGFIITSSEEMVHNSTKDNTILTFCSTLRPELQQCTYTFLQRHRPLPSSTANTFHVCRLYCDPGVMSRGGFRKLNGSTDHNWRTRVFVY
jgi:hypothetical protein